ncbi:MAG: serine/threonine protein kinase [Myxococcaceae bacterium]|nr:serine/threonine protein kinase [Myxococcaceae bacterium]
MSVSQQYRLTGKLEGGELAELFRAERDGGGTAVVKLFHERTSVKAYARAIAEASHKLTGIAHPGISHVIDIGLVRRRLAIVREDSGRYSLGQALQRLNTKEVVITATLAMGLVIDLLDAVTEAHAAGVLHGAMTPGNVLLGAEGRPAICDFGALAALNSVPALKKNFAGRGRSTYRAPELAKGDAITVQSDVYSLGAMTYELLTLREAGSEGTQVSTRREAVPPPSRLDRRLNSRIDPIIMRALDPVPGRRYKTTVEFASSLREFLTANGGLPPREELKRFVDQLFPREMQMEPGGVMPFTDPFSLEGIEGADVDEIEDRSVVLTPRASFSGSLDDMPATPMPALATPDPDGLTPPAYDVERERSTDWHAPEGAMPATARSGAKEAINPDVLKRMRRIEDFEGVREKTDEKAHAEATDELPKLFKPELVAERAAPERAVPERSAPERSAPVTEPPHPAESQPVTMENSIVGDDGKRRRMITEERNLAKAEAARKRWVTIVAGSAFAALAFLAIGMWRWSAGEEVPQYVPPPVERQRTVRRPPPQAQPKPTPREREKDDDRPKVENCYAPKKSQPTGVLSVTATKAITVSIDDDMVCGSHSRILVNVGTRKIVVTDARTGEKQVSSTRIEQNKQIRLIPIFKNK